MSNEKVSMNEGLIAASWRDAVLVRFQKEWRLGDVDARRTRASPWGLASGEIPLAGALSPNRPSSVFHGLPRARSPFASKAPVGRRWKTRRRVSRRRRRAADFAEQLVAGAVERLGGLHAG